MKSNMLLGDLQVKDIHHLLVENPASVPAGAPMRDVLAKMIEDLRTRQVYIVDDEDHLLGVVRMNSVVEYLFPYNAIVEHSKSLYDAYIPKIGAQTAADLMISPPIRVTGETTLGEMARLMIKEGINELPVVDGRERLIGQVNTYETINAYLDIVQRSSVD
jgi:CBS domain-containing protein